MLGLLLRLSLLLLLSMLLFRLGLLRFSLLSRLGLLVRLALFFALFLLLCVARSSDSEKQRQNRCAGDSNYFHRCYLITARYVRLL